MQFEFSRPQHKQIKKKNISVGNEILSLSSVARQLSELRIAEALKISLKKVWLESTFAPVSSYLHTTTKNWSLLKKLRFGLCIMKNFPQDVSHLPFKPIFAILYYSGSLLVCFYLFHVLVHKQTFNFLGFLVLKGNSLTHQLAVNDKAATSALASLPWVR